MSTKRWIIFIAAELIPPTLFLIVLTAVGLFRPEPTLGAIGTVLATYGGWAAFLHYVKLLDFLREIARTAEGASTTAPAGQSVMAGGDIRDSEIRQAGGDIIEGDQIVYQTSAAPIITTPFNLPPDLGDFTGREAEVAAVREQLLVEGAINITSGMGGIGKTALAVHVAHGLAGEGRFRGRAAVY